MQAPKVRGIATGAQPLSEAEKAQLLKDLEGNWKIVSLESTTSGQMIYTDAMVRDDYYIISGGMHNETRHVGKYDSGAHRNITTSVANATQKQTFHFFKDSAGTIYTDFAGSMISKMDFAGGEVELDNALGGKLLWQRLWKQQGLAPLQAQMA